MSRFKVGDFVIGNDGCIEKYTYTKAGTVWEVEGMNGITRRLSLKPILGLSPPCEAVQITAHEDDFNLWRRGDFTQAMKMPPPITGLQDIFDESILRRTMAAPNTFHVRRGDAHNEDVYRYLGLTRGAPSTHMIFDELADFKPSKQQEETISITKKRHSIRLSYDG